jgi:hypothetical protein
MLPKGSSSRRDAAHAAETAVTSRMPPLPERPTKNPT